MEEKKKGLFELMQDNFSPEACAAIAAFLDGADTTSFEVNKELTWFAEKLRELVGGEKEWARLCEDIGL